MNQKLVKSKTLANLLDLPVYSVRKLARDGKIPCYKIDNKNFLFDPDEVVECIKNGLKKSINNDSMSLTVTDAHEEE